MRVLLGRDGMPRKRWTLRLLWEPRDMWIGVFWNRVQAGGPADRFVFVYVCVIPCLPLVLAVRSRVASGLEVASSRTAKASNQESRP